MTSPRSPDDGIPSDASRRQFLGTAGVSTAGVVVAPMLLSASTPARAATAPEMGKPATYKAQDLSPETTMDAGQPFTTNQGLKVADNQSSLKAGLRGRPCSKTRCCARRSPRSITSAYTDASCMPTGPRHTASPRSTSRCRTSLAFTARPLPKARSPSWQSTACWVRRQVSPGREVSASRPMRARCPAASSPTSLSTGIGLGPTRIPWLPEAPRCTLNHSASNAPTLALISPMSKGLTMSPMPGLIVPVGIPAPSA